jgi:glutamate/tyrosine decarboxylase-like PLP-dependent enzyme
MSTDQSLPAILGYLSTMFYNPNNVAFEASPFTTRLEILVGQQLCTMLGYAPDTGKTDAAWGHITCDGSIANLESVW